MSKEEYLREILKWVSSDSILVIDNNNVLRRIYTPFKAICLATFPDIDQGEKVSIEAIKLTVEIKEVFIIKGIPYYIIYFKIIME